MSTLRTIGTDTEIFGYHTAKDRHAALCGLIGGSKDEPKPMGIADGFALQEDNVAVEFNIPPGRTAGEFANHIAIALNETKKALEAVGMTISNHVGVSYHVLELMHPTARVFGCDPDYNAWSGEENPRPVALDEKLRTAGGHVHVGSDGNMIKCVQMMDLFLGVPSVLLDTAPGSVTRRELYGKAGAMRPKPYGWEYRVLSNYWVFSSELRHWVFNNTKAAVEMSEVLNIGVKKSQRIQGCINKGLKDVAIELIEEFGIQLPRGINVEHYKAIG